MDIKRVKIVTFAPSENADEIRAALGAAGAATIGEYSFCSFTCSGEGRFAPTDDAKPHIGPRINQKSLKKSASKSSVTA